MLNLKIRNLAVTGITIASATVFTALSSISASAATTAADTHSHLSAPGTAAATACVDQTFVFSPNTYQPCVRDEQILLNDLWYVDAPGPDQLLATDGSYGAHTADDVSSFNGYWHPSNMPTYVGETTPGHFGTWGGLCFDTWQHGFHGTYWQAAGCATIFPGL